MPRVTVDLQVYPIAVLSRREIAPALGGILQPRPHSGAHLDHSIWNAEQTNSSPALPGCEYIARNVRDEGCVVCITVSISAPTTRLNFLVVPLREDHLVRVRVRVRVRIRVRVRVRVRTPLLWL